MSNLDLELATKKQNKLKELFKKYEDKIILTIGAILIAVFSFIAGRISITVQPKPIEIKENQNQQAIPQTEEKKTTVDNKANGNDKNIEIEGKFVADVNKTIFYPSNSPEALKIPEADRIWFDTEEEAEEAGYVKNTEQDSQQSISTENNKPLYVASKNGKKYHLLDSKVAKRIKEENRIFFYSKEEAEEAGYTPGKSVLEAEGENN